MDKMVTSPTWDEYLAQMSSYLCAVSQAIQVGSKSALEPPSRPTGLISDEYRDQAGRLSEACDQLVAQVIARMTVIASRPPSAHQSPHQEYPIASYLETDM